MSSQEIIDTETFRRMLEAARAQLDDHTDFVNSLNVFPVPDGDTGTNMALSFQTGVEHVRQAADASAIDVLTQALAKGLLMGARGNSGVILSQLFRGFAKGSEDQTELDGAGLANALSEGVKVAYRAVMKPVEGTILTVAREAAEAGQVAADAGGDATKVMQAVYDAAKTALADTPNHLAVLKEVGVVDSGGQGLTLIYNGFLEALTGESIALPTEDIQHIDLREMAHEENYYNTSHSVDSKDIKYGYCTQMLIRLNDGPTVEEQFDYDTFRNHLDEVGDSLIVVNDDEFVKVHVHTENPGQVLNYGQKFGSLATVKVDNMRGQHDAILDNQGSEATHQKNTRPKQKAHYSVIAVAAGEGLKELFLSAGATDVINGGQTMNPSTADIVSAIEDADAEEVIVLPNNKNIVMASKQAVDVVEQTAAVVETASISQGLTALLGFNPDDDLETNVENMNAEKENVVSGQVTHAVRDTEIEGLSIKEGDYMGIVDGAIKTADADLHTATLATIEAMLDDDSEIVTLIYGADADEAAAEQLEADFTAEHPDIDFEIYDGGQPVYNYFISVE